MTVRVWYMKDGQGPFPFTFDGVFSIVSDGHKLTIRHLESFEYLPWVASLDMNRVRLIERID